MSLILVCDSCHPQNRKPVDVSVWSVNFWMKSSFSPEPASSIHCLDSTSCVTLCCLRIQAPDILFKLDNVCGRRDPDVEGELKSDGRLLSGIRLEV